MNDITTNPFEARRALADTAAGRVQQARESTEVLAMIYSARQNPRNELHACDRIRDAFQRAGLAEESQYSFQRGGTDIAGPSIRSAEAIRLAWGNMATGWSELSRFVGADGVGVSEIEAFAVDYETVNREAIKFHVRHWRDTKKGGYPLKDERDIFETCASQAQRRKRACILALIPGDVIAMAMDQATATLRTRADTSPEGMARMLEAFAPYDVTKAHIEKRIQRRLDAIQPAQVVQLKRIFASLRDGISTPGDWFELTPPGEGSDAAGSSAPPTSAKEVIGKRRASRTRTAVEPPANDAGEIDGTPVPLSLAQYLVAMAGTTDSDGALLVLDAARSALEPDELAQLSAAYSEKWQGGES
jgi:hypothetical protein